MVQPASKRLVTEAAASARYAQKSSLFLNASDYGARGDRETLTGGSITAGSTQLTASGLNQTHVGKLVVIPGAASNNAGTGLPDNLAATIQSVIAGVATLSTTAATTVSSASFYVGTNNSTPIADLQAAVPAGGATLFFPRGTYLYSSQIAPKDHTIWVGEGRGVTVFNPVSTTHGFYRMGNTVAPYGPTPTPDAPVTGVQWRDLTVDGALATGQMKGWYLNHMIECVWERTSCLNTGASGYGCDYLQDCWFNEAIVRNAGRAGSTSSAGFSGFGIGSGAFTRENVYFNNCVATGNKRFGLFLENQDTATQSFGAQVNGGLFMGNQWGISDNGTDSLIVNGAHIKDNVADGFILTTTAAIEEVGIRGQVMNCTITGNGGDGVQFDWTQADTITWGNYVVKNNLIESNGGYGVRTRVAAGMTLSEMVIESNVIRRNVAAGIGVFGGILKDSGINRNTITDNGTGGVLPRGIMVAGDVTDCTIDQNRIGDTRATGKTQLHGLWFSATAPTITMTGGRVAGNDLRGNGTAGIGNAAQMSTTTRIRDNDGYNPIGADALTVGASPYSYTAGGVRETHYIIGGTFSTIQINGVTVYNSGANAGTIVLPIDAGATVVYTYSVVPVAIKRWRH